MIRIKKHFHFYAAHRNETIEGRCSSIHGHRYGLTVGVEYPVVDGIAILFSDLERHVLPLIGELDHSLLLHSQDPAKDALLQSGACSRVYVVPWPTSAENMASHILQRLRESGLNVVQLSLQETDTSIVEINNEQLFRQ